MATPDQIRATVDAYVDGYTRADREAVISLFAPDAELHDPVGTPVHVGADGIRNFWDQVRSLTETIKLVPQEIVVCGNEAVMIVAIAAGTEGAGVRMNAVDVFEFDDAAKITRLKAYWDMEQGQPF
ncbi:MAG: nuclear transport factor 2 family protein [Acidimicrobiia bacterium]